jgi:hypothetical protein
VKEELAMSMVKHFVLAASLGTIIAALPFAANATSVRLPSATSDANIIKWERSRANYLRDQEFAEAAMNSKDSTDYATKSNLINARYLIKLAEIDDEDLKQHEKARRVLKLAQHYLDLAKTNAKATDQIQIQQIGNDLPMDTIQPQQACDTILRDEQRHYYNQLASELDDLVTPN